MPRLKLALLSLLLASPLAPAASFNCDKAASAVEKMVCATPELSRQDDYLAGSYKRAVARTGDRQALRELQRTWLKSGALNGCKTGACVKLAYGTRIKLLDDAVKSPWNGHYVRQFKGKPDRHASDIVLVELVQGGVAGEGTTTWLGPNAAKGQVHQGELNAVGAFSGKTLAFKSGSCRVSMTLKGAQLVVEDNNQCGGANATFSGRYRRK